MVRALLDLYYRLLRLILTVLMAAIVVPVTMQILSRYTGVIPRFIWTEEIARFCFVWIILIGAMIAVRDDTHFDVDLLSRSSRPGVELALFLLRAGLMAAVALTFVIYGYDFAILGSRQRSEISGLPMLAIYIAWPIAGVTWLLFLGEKIVLEIGAYRARDANGPH
jgi:TRAP-type C4-dicarboxylate transport system permease small subunit